MLRRRLDVRQSAFTEKLDHGANLIHDPKAPDVQRDVQLDRSQYDEPAPQPASEPCLSNYIDNSGNCYNYTTGQLWSCFDAASQGDAPRARPTIWAPANCVADGTCPGSAAAQNACPLDHDGERLQRTDRRRATVLHVLLAHRSLAAQRPAYVQCGRSLRSLRVQHEGPHERISGAPILVQCVQPRALRCARIVAGMDVECRSRQSRRVRLVQRARRKFGAVDRSGQRPLQRRFGFYDVECLSAANRRHVALEPGYGRSRVVRALRARRSFGVLPR